MARKQCQCYICVGRTLKKRLTPAEQVRLLFLAEHMAGSGSDLLRMTAGIAKTKKDLLQRLPWYEAQDMAGAAINDFNEWADKTVGKRKSKRYPKKKRKGIA